MSNETKWAADLWSHLDEGERERIRFEGADDLRDDLAQECDADTDVDAVLLELERLAGFGRLAEEE